jgi:hypothetical protein
VSDITPYIHLFVCHTVELLQLHGPLGQFSCQGLEKVNSVHKKLYFGATSRDGGRLGASGVNRRSASMQILRNSLRKLVRQDDEDYTIATNRRTILNLPCDCGRIFHYKSSFLKHLTQHAHKPAAC